MGEWGVSGTNRLGEDVGLETVSLRRDRVTVVVGKESDGYCHCSVRRALIVD